MERLSKVIVLLLLTAIILFACMKDDMRPITEFNTDSGVFIVCEGNFMYGNASLHYYDVKKNEIYNNVFLSANGIPLGDVAQSMILIDSTAYIVVNNSGKIVAIDKNSFKIRGEISGLVSPRYISPVSEHKAYVSDLYSKKISVVNLQNLELLDEICINADDNNSAKYSSENMILYNNLMFTNSWSYDSTILVIDLKDKIIIDSIPVLVQPKKMLIDRNHYLWVLCDGGFPGSHIHGKAGVLKICTESLSVKKRFYFDKNDNPTDMQINSGGDTIYYINNSLYRFSIYDNDLPENPYINSDGRNLYAVGINPVNSDIYLSDAVDYLQSGVIYRYDNYKHLIDSFRVGIIPNSFIFKP